MSSTGIGNLLYQIVPAGNERGYGYSWHVGDGAGPEQFWWDPIREGKPGFNCWYRQGVAAAYSPIHRVVELHVEGFTVPMFLRSNMARIADGSLVAVCREMELLGHGVPQEWLDYVLDAVRKTPRLRFMLQTAFSEWLSTVHWPSNCLVGVIVRTQQDVRPALQALHELKQRDWASGRPGATFIAFEPASPSVKLRAGRQGRCGGFNLKNAGVDWLIVGSCGEAGRQTDLQWLASVIDEAEVCDCRVFVRDIQRMRAYPPQLRGGASIANVGNAA